jgi:ABC-type xylose transport system permease subunit
MALLSGLAAAVFTAYMNSALLQSGRSFEMDATAACYIGGVSVSGGIGTVVVVIISGLCYNKTQPDRVCPDPKFIQCGGVSWRIFM